MDYSLDLYPKIKRKHMKLDQIRKDIDQIDQELVTLLEKRLVCVSQIIEYKEQQGYLCLIKEGKERCLRKSALL